MTDSVGERVPSVLLQAGRAVRRFLEEVLPPLSSSWWAEFVVAKLSFQQQRAVATLRISALSGLDLAALLRVLDENWYAVADKLLLPSEARHYLKEMRTVRDRWAHAAAADFSEDDVYRDLDTIQRFLVSINADEELLSEVKRLKGASLAAVGGTVESASEAPIPSPATAFTVGQVVSLKSNPATTGAVVGVHPGHPEARYSVCGGIMRVLWNGAYDPQAITTYPAISGHIAI